MLDEELPYTQLRNTDSFRTKVGPLSAIIIDHKLKFISIGIFTGMQSSTSVVYRSSVFTMKFFITTENRWILLQFTLDTDVRYGFIHLLWINISVIVRVFLQKSLVMNWFTHCSCSTSAFTCEHLCQEGISFHILDPLPWCTACYPVLGFCRNQGLLGPPCLVSVFGNPMRLCLRVGPS